MARASMRAVIAVGSLLGALPSVLFIGLATLLLLHRVVSPVINRGLYRLVIKWRKVLLPLGVALIGLGAPAFAGLIGALAKALG